MQEIAKRCWLLLPKKKDLVSCWYRSATHIPSELECPTVKMHVCPLCGVQHAMLRFESGESGCGCIMQ